MRKVYLILAIVFEASVVTSFSIAGAYFFIDYLCGYTLTWPMLLLAWWVMEVITERRLTDEAKVANLSRRRI